MGKKGTLSYAPVSEVLGESWVRIDACTEVINRLKKEPKTATRDRCIAIVRAYITELETEEQR